MSYATPASMLSWYAGAAEEFRQLTNPNGASADTSMLQERLDDAQAMIDGKLGQRYAVPLAAPPRTVLDAERKLARYALYPAASSYDGQGKPTQWRQDRDDVMMWLAAIAAGGEDLIGDDGVKLAPAAAEDGLGVEYDAPERVFDAAGLEGY
jgi:phage gp36-like protein